jgi:hypothetical protein
MRTGITREQVKAGVDAFLGAGENPIVEKEGTRRSSVPALIRCTA